MRRATVLLVFIVSCRFDLPEVGTLGADSGIDSSPPIDTPPPTCPSNYTPLTGGTAGHVYRRAPADDIWLNQFDFCRSTSTRAHLAVPNDAAELTAIATLGGGALLWVGIHDRTTEGTYIDVVTGAPATFLPWAAGEPDNPGSGSGEDCVATTSTTLSTEACTLSSAFRPAVCECEP